MPDTNAFVYILQCSDNTLYTGCTKDIKRRILQHQNGKAAKYTKGRRPVTLMYVESCKNYKAALSRENVIKKLSRREKQILCKKQIINKSLAQI